MRRAVAFAALALSIPAAGEEPTQELNLDWRRNPLSLKSYASYYVSPVSMPAGAQPGDERLARWAIESWDEALGGLFCVRPEPATRARIRVYWGMTPEGLGRMQTIDVDGDRGGEVYLQLKGHLMAEAFREDPLLRAVFVYRTLQHEVGHVLGLPHSLSLDDVMYFGGDVGGYYQRYRDRINGVDEIRDVPGLSQEDLSRLRSLYPPNALWRESAERLEKAEDAEEK